MKNTTITTTVHSILDAEPSVRLAEVLLDAGLITEDQLLVALNAKREKNETLCRTLVELGLVSERVINELQAGESAYDSVDLERCFPDRSALQLVPKEAALRCGTLPIFLDENRHVLTLAVADTSNLEDIERVIGRTGKSVQITALQASQDDIESAIQRFYRYETAIPGLIREIEASDVRDSNDAVESGEYGHPVVRLVYALLADSVKRGASGIHFEPESAFLRVRYRIDGVLQQVTVLQRKYWPCIAAFLKTKSNEEQADASEAGHGQFTMMLAGRHFAFHIACHATTHGENIVLQVVEPRKLAVPLEDLELEAGQLQSLQMIMARPQGIVFVTGPRDSGKTTTLYSLLNYRNDESVNIMTIDSSVQYSVPMIRQSLLSNSQSPDFAGNYGSMMRQNPDVVLMDDLHDVGSAEKAFRAAMTGRQVYVSMCAHSALGVIAHLVEFGLKRQTVAQNIIGIVSQRLVRRLCQQCKQSYVPDQVECKILGIAMTETRILYRESACESCNYRGYVGRVGVFEVLRLNDEIDELIAVGASHKKLRDAAQRGGFKEISEDSIRHVLDGTTSVSEISRVVDLTKSLR